MGCPLAWTAPEVLFAHTVGWAVLGTCLPATLALYTALSARRTAESNRLNPFSQEVGLHSQSAHDGAAGGLTDAKNHKGNGVGRMTGSHPGQERVT